MLHQQLFIQAGYCVAPWRRRRNCPQEKERPPDRNHHVRNHYALRHEDQEINGGAQPELRIWSPSMPGSRWRRPWRGSFRQADFSRPGHLHDELIDELVGGIRSAGLTPEGGSGKGHPQVVCPGAIDSVNFGPPNTVPPKFAGRNFFSHSPVTTLMRSNVSENERLGQWIAEKLSRRKG